MKGHGASLREVIVSDNNVHHLVESFIQSTLQ